MDFQLKKKIKKNIASTLYYLFCKSLHKQTSTTVINLLYSQGLINLQAFCDNIITSFVLKVVANILANKLSFP